MLYYRHDGNYLLIEKSSEPLEGDNVLYCEDDFDLDLYDVIVGFVQNDGRILRHTKRLRSVDAIERRYNELYEYVSSYNIELDFRLCLLELGLINMS